MYVLQLNLKGIQALTKIKMFEFDKKDQSLKVDSITGSSAYPWTIKVRIKPEGTQYSINGDLVDYFYKVDVTT